jgi:hypothetical protein
LLLLTFASVFAFVLSWEFLVVLLAAEFFLAALEAENVWWEREFSRALGNDRRTFWRGLRTEN